MIRPGEPYTLAYRDPIPGDGSSACYAEREVFFDEKFTRSRLYRREGLAHGDKIPGPAIITEYTSATVLPPHCYAEVDGFGNLIITVPEENA
jgi:N-methylhydantoinase A